MRKSLLTVLVCLLSVMTALADLPFRNHRYDAFKVLGSSSGKIVFVGNSITNMNTWWEAFGDTSVVNRGVSGAVSDEVIANLETILADKPAKIFYMIGTNDLGTAGINDPARVAKNVRTIMTRTKKESPKTQVYFQSILPTVAAGAGTTRVEADLKRANDSIKKICTEYNATYVDLWNDLYGILQNNSKYTLDKIHPTGYAYSVWCKKIASLVGKTCAFPDNADNNFCGVTNAQHAMRASTFSLLPVKTGDIVILGDATINGGEWQELLHSDKVRARGTGWGVPGCDLNTMALMTKGIFKGRSDNGAPAQVYIYMGMADLVASGAQMTDVQNKYKALVDSVRKYAPSAKLFFMGLLPYSNATYATNLVKPFNEYLKKLPSSVSNSEYVDCFTQLANADGSPKAEYFTGVYLYGKGYAKLSQILAQKMGNGVRATTDAEAAARLKLLATRTTAANAITTAASLPVGNAVGQYSKEAVASLTSKADEVYALLAAETTDTAALKAKGAELNTAVTSTLEKLNLPTASTEGNEVWYELYTPLRNNRYVTSNGAGNPATGVSPRTGYARSMWKFVKRSDNKYDIVNREDKTYLNPVANYNSAISTVAAAPASGWELSYAATPGYFIIRSGNVELNQTTASGQLNQIYNWSADGKGLDRNDTGCQYAIVAAGDPVAEPEVGIVKTTTVTDGKFAEGTTWYTLQMTAGGLYISNPGTATSISLSQATSELNDKDLWCFTGNSKTGYRIYNKEAGAAKVLAAPATMSGTTGSTAYVILKDASSLGTYKADWEFTSTNVLGTDKPAYYMNPVGQTSNKVNNRGGKVAFWTEGAGAGSAIQIRFAQADLKVALSTGTPNSTGNFFSSWTSTATDPRLTLSVGANNIAKDGDNLVAYVGQISGPYTLSVPTGYAVKSYSFSAVNKTKGSNNTITAGTQTLTTSDTEQAFSVKDIKEGATSTTFTLSGANTGVVLKNFFVTVTRTEAKPEAWTDIFLMKPGMTVNRIPAIGTAHNGNLIAVADYRYSGGDIGMVGKNPTDLRFRVSKDNGKTWGDVKTLAKGQGSSAKDDMHIGFGDPCIVGDRESNRVLVTSAAGLTSFPAGTRQNHLYFVSFLSEDNGETWGQPVDLTEQIYKQFDTSKAYGPIKSFFVGSGKIHQSRYIKVGDTYRLYCAALIKDKNGTNMNFVLYSDDFGKNWKVLGGVEQSPIPSGGDEPKAEELPDGSVVISSRASGGRYYNIFNATDIIKGEGTWGTSAYSGQANKGVYGINQSCNGEILVTPAIRKADSKQVYIALQSLPFGSGRTNVGIYYKELATLADFATPDSLAKDWDGRRQCSTLGSAYSTMCVQQNDSIAFLYEEETYGAGYNIVYKSYDLQTITDSLYRMPKKGEFNADAFFKTCGSAKVAMAKASAGKYVGMIDETKVSDLEAAGKAFETNPTQDTYQAINAVIAASQVKLVSGGVYTLANKMYTAHPFLVPNGTGYTSKAASDTTSTVKFTFLVNADGTWKIYNADSKRWMAPTNGTSVAISSVTAEDKAGNYNVTSSTGGLSFLTCANATKSGYLCPHIDAKNNLVVWEGSADASQWKILPVSIPEVPTPPTGIEDVTAPEAQGQVRIYDLQGRRVTNPTRGIYIVNGRKQLIR